MQVYYADCNMLSPAHWHQVYFSDMCCSDKEVVQEIYQDCFTTAGVPHPREEPCVHRRCPEEVYPEHACM